MAKSKALVKVGKIQQRILLIRGEKVIIDADLAELTALPLRLLTKPSAATPAGSLPISCFASPKRRNWRW